MANFNHEKTTVIQRAEYEPPRALPIYKVYYNAVCTIGWGIYDCSYGHGDALWGTE